MRTILVIVFIGLSSATIIAQDNKYSVQEAINYALKNNLNISAAGFEVESQKQLKKTSFDLPKTEVSLLYGQYNSYSKNDNNITVTQSIPFSSFGSNGKLNKSLLVSSELKKASSENELVYEVKRTYFLLAYKHAVRKLLFQQDSIFGEFYRAASARFKAGETNLLEQTTAEVQWNDAKNRTLQNDSEIIILRTQLKNLLNTSVLPDILDGELDELSFLLPDTSIISQNPSLQYARQQIAVAENERKLQTAKSAPDLLIGFFNQTLVGTIHPETGALATNSERFIGFQVGMSLPLWFASQHGRIKSAAFKVKVAEINYSANQLNLASQVEQAIQSIQKNRNSLNYYQSSALPNADLILKQSQAGFRGGDIGYTEYLLALRNALSIRENYLQTLNDYNQSIIFMEFLLGNK